MRKIKMLKILILLTLIIGFLPACSDDDDGSDLTYEMFTSSLEANMHYDAVVEIFGEPDYNVGSGITYYIYTLNDETEVWIFYAGWEVWEASHRSKDGTLLETFIDVLNE